jgi:glucokinase
VAGDTALVFMARGGVYLAGGITARIAPVLKAGAFRAAFVDKWPHGKLMEGIATAIITKEDAALAGIAAFARTPAKFGVEVGGRRWRG